jgi:Tripartite tricarboxylate transporter TctB family
MKFELKITSSKDFWAGLMFIAFGLAFWYIADKNYQMGTSVRMGPAYFPVVLGGILAALGLAVFVLGFVAKSSDPPLAIPFRPWYLVAGLALGAVAFFLRDMRDATLPGYTLGKEVVHTVMSAIAVVVAFGAFPIKVLPFRIWRLTAGLALGGFAYWWFTKIPPHEAHFAVLIGHTLVSGLSVGLIFAAFGERSLWVILFSVVVFGYLLKPLGLVAATVLLVVISAWGGHEFKPKEVVILSAALALFSVLAFVKGLGLPMNPWPAIWE